MTARFTLVAFLAGCSETIADSGTTDSPGVDSPPYNDDELADSGDSGDSGDGNDSGDDDEPRASPFVVTAIWDSAGLSLSLTNADYSSWMLGMAETGAGAAGWFGETCIFGAEPNGYDDQRYDYCHDGVSRSGIRLNLAEPFDPGSVVENSTTLFTSTIAAAGNITYVVATIDPDGGCYAFGHDPVYYRNYGCTEL